MTDDLTPKQRSYCMSKNKREGTNPEIFICTLIHSLRYLYRLHRRDLPGCPDMVFPKRKKVIFINGCFWHRHNCKKGRSIPTTRKKFWRAKFERTIERDKQNITKLKKLGWKVLVVWECQIKDFDKVKNKIERFLKEK